MDNNGSHVNNLSPDQKAQLNMLEVQAGLPVGFYSSINIPPGGEILSTTNAGEITQVLVKHPDGIVEVQNYKTGSNQAQEQTGGTK